MFKHYRLPFLALSCVVLAAAAGCNGSSRSSLTAPTPADLSESSEASGSVSPDLASFLGTWRSEPASQSRLSPLRSASAAPELRACRNFEWDVTSQTSTVIGGALSVECADGISLVATAAGHLLSAASIDLDVSGSADVPGVGACAFTLQGAGVLRDADTLAITYTGTTCLGPVSGVTTLYRDALFPPPPAPEPPPAPPVDPPPAPAPPALSVPCTSNHGPAIVACIEGHFPDRLRGGISHDERVQNMAFLRDRVIEAGKCGGIDLARNLKRGVGPHSIDALAWRHPNGSVDVVDIGMAYDNPSIPLRLSWQIVAGPPGYDPYPQPACQ